MTTQTETQTAIKAVVNEKNFFAAMKHLFASSFAVVGELLQNSRRAGATRIDVNFDYQSSVLEFIDNGHGISDFSKLLELSASGWSEETKIKENPFGMGFFSCFGVAKSVEVRSKGTMLIACIEDLVEGKKIVLRQTDEADEHTTVIRLHGVSVELLGSYEDEFGERLQSLVYGFDTPVFLNGVEMKRPHAKAAMKGEETIIGFVHLKGVHGDHYGYPISSGRSTALYLQGLPIAETTSGVYRKQAEQVIHLDGSRFIPQMPDRKYLFDQSKQIEIVKTEIQEVYKRHLVSQKIALNGHRFVELHAQDAIYFGVPHLLNDIPYLPKSFFEICEAAVMNTEYESTFSTAQDNGVSLFSMQDFVDGNLRVWLNAPHDAAEEAWAGVAMKVMIRDDILNLGTEGLDPEHWIFKHATDYLDLSFSVQLQGAQDKTIDYSWNDRSATIGIAQQATVKVLKSDEFLFEHLVSSDWLMVPKCDDENTEEFHCWLMGTVSSTDHPVNALSTFFNEHDFHMEDWEDEAKRNWADTVGQLFNEHMTAKIGRAMADQYVVYSEEAAGEFGFVRLVRKNYGGDHYDRLQEDFVAVDHTFMANLTEALKLETGCKDLATKQVISALLSVVRPNLHVDGPRDGDHISQW